MGVGLDLGGESAVLRLITDEDAPGLLDGVPLHLQGKRSHVWGFVWSQLGEVEFESGLEVMFECGFK